MLPPGFDPATGKLRNIQIAVPINQSASSYSYSNRRNWWGSFNEGVASIGNWVADWVDNACTIVMWIILCATWIGAIFVVIDQFIQGNIFSAIICMLLGGAIVYYGAYIFAGIGWLCTAVVLYSIRFLFWNGWTLLIALILTLSMIWSSSESNSKISTKKASTTTEYVKSSTTTYYCTANALNIRTSPNTYSSVLGTLQKGEKIEVYEISNGFAKIKYKTVFAYVSSQYIKKK